MIIWLSCYIISFLLPLLSQMWDLQGGLKPLPAFSYFLPVFLHRCFLKQIFSWVLLREPKLVPSIQIFKWSEGRPFGDILLHLVWSLFTRVAKNWSEKPKHPPPNTQNILLLKTIQLMHQRNCNHWLQTNSFHLLLHKWILTHCRDQSWSPQWWVNFLWWTKL